MDPDSKIVSPAKAGLILSFKVCAAEQNVARTAMCRLNQGLTNSFQGTERRGKPQPIFQVLWHPKPLKGFSDRIPVTWRVNSRIFLIFFFN